MKSVVSFFCIFVSAIFLMSSALAEMVSDKKIYINPNLVTVTDTALALGVLPIDNKDIFLEYARLKYCDVYKMVFNDQFQLKALYDQFIEKKEELTENIGYRYFKVPVYVDVKGYNFTTESIDIHPDFYITNVGTLELHRGTNLSSCVVPGYTLQSQAEYNHIPTKYALFLSQKLNLRRIPLGKSIGQKVFQQVQKNRIYLDIYTVVEGAKKEIEGTGRGDTKQISFMGAVKKIDFYTDSRRTTPFKTIYYQ